MHFPPYTVTGVFAHYGIPPAFGIILYRCSDIPQSGSMTDGGDTGFQSPLGGFNKFTGCRGNLSDANRYRGVALKAIENRPEIKRDNIAFFQNAIPGNPVNNLIINRS